MPDHDPQRRYPRLPESIDCQVEGASGHASLRVSELSLGGCYVDTRMQFGVDTPMTIRAAFPTGEAVFTGRVIYEQAGYGFGVAFDAWFPAKLLASAIKAVRSGGRIVGPVTIPAPAELSVLAHDETYWVAQKAPEVVKLSRASR